MDEQHFRHLADMAFEQIQDAFESVDAEDADLEVAGGVLHITFRGGQRVVVNTQAATRQIWLAGGKSGWHFDYDEASGRWVHDKGTGDELMSELARLAREAAGLSLQI